MDDRSHCTVLYTPLQMGSEDEESNRKTRNSLPSVALLTFEKNWNILPYIPSTRVDPGSMGQETRHLSLPRFEPTPLPGRLTSLGGL